MRLFNCFRSNPKNMKDESNNVANTHRVVILANPCLSQELTQRIFLSLFTRACFTFILLIIHFPQTQEPKWILWNEGLNGLPSATLKPDTRHDPNDWLIDLFVIEKVTQVANVVGWELKLKHGHASFRGVASGMASGGFHSTLFLFGNFSRD